MDVFNRLSPTLDQLKCHKVSMSFGITCDKLLRQYGFACNEMTNKMILKGQWYYILRYKK